MSVARAGVLRTCPGVRSGNPRRLDENAGDVRKYPPGTLIDSVGRRPPAVDVHRAGPESVLDTQNIRVRIGLPVVEGTRATDQKIDVSG
jgi:hypothetical protein